MSTPIAEGVVLVTADAKNIPKEVARQIEGDQAPIESAGRKSGGSLFGGFVKAAAVGTAAIATTVGGLAIAGGFSRALSIQDATKKLEGLGHDTQNVASIMDSALNSVRGTAFGLGAAATTSAGLVAAGVGLGDELTRRLKTVADTATIAGRSMEDVGTIFGSVAAKGRLQGDDLLQLMSSGVPVLQILAEHLGTTSEEISELVSKGKIDFNTFADAMESSLGGAALRGGETARGAFANVMAALGRMGAAFVTPLVAGAPALFSSISGAVDGVTASLSPLAEGFAARITPAIQGLAEWLGALDFTAIINGIATFSPLVQVLRILEPILPAILGAVMPLGPALAELATALGPLLQSALVAVLPALVTLIELAAELATLLVPMISFLTENVEVVVSLGVAIGAAALAYQAWTGAITLWQNATKIAAGVQAAFNAVMAANPIMLIVTAIAALVAGLVYFFTQTELGQQIWANFTQFLGEAWTNIVNFATETWTALADFFSDLWEGIVDGVVTAWTAVSDFLAPFFEFIGGLIKFQVEVWTNIFLVLAAVFVTVWNWIVEIFTNAWNAIVAFVSPIVNFIVNMIVSWFNGLVTTWTGVWNAISSVVANVWNAIVGFITPIVNSVVMAVRGPIAALQSWWNGVWNAISGFFGGIWNGMVGAVSGAVGRVGEVVGGIWNIVTGALGNVGGWLVGMGKDLVRGFWEGIVAMGDWLWRQVTGFFDDVTGWAKDVLGIQSPSRVFRLEVGQMVGEGMALGIRDSTMRVEHAMQGLIPRAEDFGITAMNNGRELAGVGMAPSAPAAGEVHFHYEAQVHTNDPLLAARAGAREASRRLGI